MMKPGDVLLYKAPAWKFSNIIPKLIQLITGNSVTHVALYLGSAYDGHIILDALSEGVLIKVMSDSEIRVRKDDFMLCGIARLPEPYYIDSARSLILLKAVKYSRKPYGFLTILNLFLQHGKTRLFPNKPWTTWLKSKDAYICSEVSQLVIEDILMEFNRSSPFPREANLMEPDDYLNKPWEVIPIDDKG